MSLQYFKNKLFKPKKEKSKARRIFDIVSIIFIIIYIPFMIMYGQNIGRFLVNIFLWPTHFETKHFIIDVPKWHWAGRYAVDNKPVFFRVEEETCCTEDNALVIYFNDFINDITTEEWKQYCDKSIEKSTQKVANGEIDKYICKTSRDDIVTIGFFYKKEVFYSYICNVNDFQSQYEKFFEGVKLKQ